MSDLSLSSMKKIIKNIDPEIRVAADTKEELRLSVEQYAIRLSELAISTARNANRNTVLSQDIITAREQLMVGVVFHRMHTPK